VNRHFDFTPVENARDRNVMDISWLEFVPREARPKVHIITSSHVIAPYLWKDYYPHEWLNVVDETHCKYTVEVYDPDQPEKVLAKVPINSDPFNHPEGRDIALIHFREEEEALRVLKDCGVHKQYWREPKKLYEKGETMLFDGFVNLEGSRVVLGELTDTPPPPPPPVEDSEQPPAFGICKINGTLAFHTNDRFFASTKDVLEEGMCGAPVLDVDGDLCGTVEGIVSKDDPNKNIAGTAAFMPSYVVRAFVDNVERNLCRAVMPPDLFTQVNNLKTTGTIGSVGFFKQDNKGTYTVPVSVGDAFEETMRKYEEKYTEKEMQAIRFMIDEEREQVLKIYEKEGGDLDDIIARVRAETIAIHEYMRENYKEVDGKLVPAREGVEPLPSQE
jgi:hypothetical protein